MQAEYIAPSTAHLIIVTVVSMIRHPLRAGYADDIYGAALSDSATTHRLALISSKNPGRRWERAT